MGLGFNFGNTLSYNTQGVTLFASYQSCLL